MIFPVEKECSHLGETCTRTDYDLIRELNRRIDSLSRYDHYIANAKDRDAVKHFWCNIKSQEQQNVQLMKELLTEEMRNVLV